MRCITGLSSAPGIALGSSHIYASRNLHVERKSCVDIQSEYAKLESGLEKARTDLDSLAKLARESIGASEAEIFTAQIEILGDPELIKRARTLVEDENVIIEYAWQTSIQYYADSIRSLGDEYLAARASDIEDVGQRVLAILMGKVAGTTHLNIPSVILAHELSPSDTLLLNRKMILAFCTEVGGPTSHVAILSKAMGIPCITGFGNLLDVVRDGTFVIVDGSSGDLFVEPDDVTIREYQSRVKTDIDIHQRALQHADSNAITRDGKLVEVVANIGSTEDAHEAMINGAEGIGLLRTEFMFLGRETAPSQAEQVAKYTEIFKEVGSTRPIVVRTLDIGGDKPAAYVKIHAENNPFLGLRGLRLSLRYKDLFIDQLCAILEAGADYDLRIMFPMVSSLEELIQAKSLIDECKQLLIANGKQYCKGPQIGIMVEVPSAAILARSFVNHIDFFSIGTNDLSQYTMAAERTSSEVAYLADPFHPAVLELIHRVSEVSHEYGKWVGLCGEMAGDPLAISLLLGLGIDEFSATPKRIPHIKQAIWGFNVADCKKIAQKALEFSNGREVRDYLIGITG